MSLMVQYVLFCDGEWRGGRGGDSGGCGGDGEEGVSKG